MRKIINSIFRLTFSLARHTFRAIFSDLPIEKNL